MRTIPHCFVYLCPASRQGTWWYLTCQCWCLQWSGQGIVIFCLYSNFLSMYVICIYILFFHIIDLSKSCLSVFSYDKGGHLYLPSYVMRTHGARQQREAVKRASRNQLQPVFEVHGPIIYSILNLRIVCFLCLLISWNLRLVSFLIVSRLLILWEVPNGG